MKTLKYSRQRESIKACLMGRRDHPTADDVYLSIRQEYPNISLGCGPDRFDADLTPHYHFVCRMCGTVMDLPLKPFPELDQKAQKCCDGAIDSHLICFYGLCRQCCSSKDKTDRITPEPFTPPKHG